jgi:hypothetical protein
MTKKERLCIVSAMSPLSSGWSVRLRREGIDEARLAERRKAAMAALGPTAGSKQNTLSMADSFGWPKRICVASKMLSPKRLPSWCS